MLAESQSRRMDDQRVSPSLLPGLQIFSSRGSAVMNQWETDQLLSSAVSSHNLGSIPQPGTQGPFCVDFACSPRVQRHTVRI
uniref:Uncharacterized protein n=1 Tax=Pygocentrus nattereri TaxID=42514 RepID=A0AAR2K4X1_PYGNA